MFRDRMDVRSANLTEPLSRRQGQVCGACVHAAEIAHASGVREFHASLRQTIPSPVKHQVRRVYLGDAGVDNYVCSSVRVEDVRALREAIVAATGEKPGFV